MDKNALERVEKIGSILQSLAGKRKIDAVTRLLLELITTKDWSRSLALVTWLGDDPLYRTTEEIAQHIGASVETTRQILRALIAGGLELRVEISSCNSYAYDLPKSSILRSL